MNKTTEVALTGPNDKRHPNGMYVYVHNSVYDGDRFRRVGSASAVVSRDDLISRGAQFHTLDVPAWVDPKDKAVKDLTALAAELRDDYYTSYAVKIEAALASLAQSGKSGSSLDSLMPF